MALKEYKPTSAARRHMTVSDFAEITKVKPEKKLTVTMRKSGGRNNHGHIRGPAGSGAREQEHAGLGLRHRLRRRRVRVAQDAGREQGIGGAQAGEGEPPLRPGQPAPT